MIRKCSHCGLMRSLNLLWPEDICLTCWQKEGDQCWCCDEIVEKCPVFDDADFVIHLNDGTRLQFSTYDTIKKESSL